MILLCKFLTTLFKLLSLQIRTPEPTKQVKTFEIPGPSHYRAALLETPGKLILKNLQPSTPETLRPTCPTEHHSRDADIETPGKLTRKKSQQSVDLTMVSYCKIK